MLTPLIGGNGYLRGSRVWDSLYYNNTLRNLRHITMQWCAMGNVVILNNMTFCINKAGIVSSMEVGRASTCLSSITYLSRTPIAQDLVRVVVAKAETKNRGPGIQSGGVQVRKRANGAVLLDQGARLYYSSWSYHIKSMQETTSNIVL
ncbi:unnamed protein product [Rhizoctonia solani]|uniref:Uncharacterized protein n=1 Tax=Rhizoctonia solani TaxID=456999 RepID=A0A8H3CYM3_9AGAM|nr:unnamed protein product [Rhizoctonia solani]